MIKFLVTGQQLVAVTPAVLVSDTINYITAKFEFNTDDWDGLTKVAYFEAADVEDTPFYVILVDDEITADRHVNLSAGNWKIYVTGLESSESTTAKITTSTVIVNVEKSLNGSTFPAVNLSVAEQLTAIVGEVKAAADAGEYDGTTFLPSVSDEGVISWSNNDGKENPVSVNIKGPKGDTGDVGPQGEQGEQGEQGVKGDTGTGLTILGYLASESDLPSDPAVGDAYAVGTEAPYDVYVYDGLNSKWVNNGTAIGVKGDKGDTGDKGDKGDKGDVGPQGPQGLTGATGPTGPAPVKGTDYWTSADKAEIINDTVNSITPASIGAIANPATKTNGQYLRWNGTAWVASNVEGGVSSVNGATGAVTVSKIFTDTVVEASAWQAQSTPTYEDYPYVASIALSGVGPLDYADVVLPVTEAISGEYAPIAETYSGGIYLYRASAAESNITIPTIVIIKG